MRRNQLVSFFYDDYVEEILESYMFYFELLEKAYVVKMPKSEGYWCNYCDVREQCRNDIDSIKTISDFRRSKYNDTC